MQTNNIKVENLSIQFPSESKATVKNMSIEFESDKITGLIGESGSGKSLLAMSILQLLPKDAIVTGNCFYKGNNLYQLNKKEIKRLCAKEIALIPQNPEQAFNPVLKIKRQLLEVLLEHTNNTKESALEIIKENLYSFGFEKPERILNAYPFQLSGGMNQRVLSIMALLCQPQWVIADEPTKGIDAILKKSIYERLAYVAEKHTKSMIVITHDLEFAYKLCDKIAVVYQGEIIEFGDAEQVIKNPQADYTKKLLAVI